MARKKSKTSDNSFMGLGLLPAEDVILQRILKKKDNVPAKRVIRMLLREWIEDEKQILQ